MYSNSTDVPLPLSQTNDNEVTARYAFFVQAKVTITVNVIKVSKVLYLLPMSLLSFIR